MKRRQSFSTFESSRRRRSGVPILSLLPVLLIALLVAALVWFWARGGEKPQTRVEHVIPVEQLGKR